MDGNVLCLVRIMLYMGVYVCQDLLNCPYKICAIFSVQIEPHFDKPIQEKCFYSCNIIYNN